MNRNPPWVDKIINKHWEVLLRVAPERGGIPVMPEPSMRGKSGKMAFKELGCGHYGCVISTVEPGIVFKVTSDASEAAFVASAGKLKEWPSGMIRYHGIYELPERHRKRRTFALWRDEADNVGQLGSVYNNAVYQKYVKRYDYSLHEFKQKLMQWRFSGHVMLEQLRRARDPKGFLEEVDSLSRIAWRTYVEQDPFIEKWHWGDRVRDVAPHYRGALAFAIRILQMDDLAGIMANTHAGSLVGEAFQYYLEQGILLADVHLGNIGEVHLPDYESWELVITDPGHMVPVLAKWLDVAIPQLPE